MEDHSRLSANRRSSMQLFILKSLITEIKRGKKVDFSQIPPEIIVLFQQEVAKSDELKEALDKQSE